jgi:hypothetical protein
MANPRATADRYVEVATADGKEALAELFAMDGLFQAPNGSDYRGRAAIADFYRQYLAQRVPTFHIHRAVSEGHDCWVELADGTTDDPVLLASSHFTVDDNNMIVRLCVYLRPQPR